MTDPTYFTDDTALATREAEVPNAAFDNGMNAGGACAAGLGINIAGGAVSGDPTNFTLLDQDAEVRVPQNSQSIGGLALGDGLEGKGDQPVLTATNQTQAAKDAAPELDGVPVITGDANLQTLNAGWVDTAV